MRPLEFFGLALWAAVMAISASQSMGLVLEVISYCAVLLGLIASFRAFQRDQQRQARGG